MIRGEITQQNTDPLGHNFFRTTTHVVNLGAGVKSLLGGIKLPANTQIR